MVSTETYTEMAMAFEEAAMLPHFEKTSFRVNKKIFGTLDLQKGRAGVKLNMVDQSIFIDFDPATFIPATGAWGRQGWTLIVLETVRKEMLQDALTCSYRNVAPKRLADKY